jgi:hypothetical protein
MPIRPGGPQCTRIKLNGERCQLPPIKGATVCGSHGGRAPQVRAAAARRVAEAEARKAAANYVADAGQLEDPLGELLRVAGQMVAFKDHLAARVEELNAEDWRYQSSQKLEQINGLVTLLQSAMRDVAKVIEAMARLDLESRRTRIAERDADMFYRAMENSIDRLGLLDREQRSRFNVIIVEELAPLIHGYRSLSWDGCCAA